MCNCKTKVSSTHSLNVAWSYCDDHRPVFWWSRDFSNVVMWMHVIPVGRCMNVVWFLRCGVNEAWFLSGIHVFVVWFPWSSPVNAMWFQLGDHDSHGIVTWLWHDSNGVCSWPLPDYLVTATKFVGNYHPNHFRRPKPIPWEHIFEIASTSNYNLCCIIH